jgi:hypothetical protein
MPPLSGALAFYTVAESLLAAAVDRLDPAPDRACIVPGELLADDDCECGTLQVAIVRTYFSDSPPAEQSGFVGGTTGGGSPCGPPYLVADLAVRIMRCAPSPEGRELAPSCEALTDSAREVETDAYMVRLAVDCLLRPMVDEDISGYLVQSQPRQGPAGGCVGSALNLSIWIVNRCLPCG